ncbi:hypothetical protein QTJ16_001860 [Diplocarpon rosae]|uniref:Peptidase S8/S53 domain-containing protein n=1 Tax=Diplocarpon rosae TaxID=946125 RepID=A0AAD9WEJ0_9HELO|nr:hypothetical protein QTJ16_001860 [Diplocarpon rosae]PBP21104.1 subtilisin-like protein [Diplocarpon rosae]
MLSRAVLSLVAAAWLVAGAPVAPILLAAKIADIIPDNWIVVMRAGVSESAFRAHLSSRDPAVVSRIKSTFRLGRFKGYSGSFTRTLVDALTTSLDIAWIEPDTRVRTLTLTSQFNASWGLSRISHREANGTSYIYDESAGEGTFAYIIDTGIYVEHAEFEGRATFGANLVGDGDDSDSNGHGTHCAGIIGSRSYGVAKKASLIGVKVFGANGSSSMSNIIAGIEWAVDDAREKGRIGRAVANLSFGGFYSRSGNAAVRAAVEAGLFVGAAAGNDGAPAFFTTPASERTACTVGATDMTDARAPYSNFGSVVDIFAPGRSIISTWIGGPTRTNTKSGTSMAVPHVVGLAAYLMGLEGPKEPGPLCEQMRQMATKKKLSGTSRSFLPGLMGTPNLLAYNDNGA